MGRNGPLLIVGVAAVVAGLIVGVGLVEDSAAFIPLTLEFLLLTGVTFGFTRTGDDPDTVRFLTRVVIVAIALRVGGMIVVYGALDPGFFASDVNSYAARGAEVAAWWRGGPESQFASRLQVGYEYLNAAFILAVGDTEYGPAVLNLFAGVWTCLIAHAIGTRCFSERVGRVAAVLTAVFPSMVLWSILNIRDALATTLISGLILLAVRAYGQVRAKDLAIFLVGAFLLTTLRDYMGILLVAGLTLGYVAAARPGRLFSTFVMGTVLALIVFFMLERLEVLSPDVIEDPFSSAAAMRRGLQQDFQGGLAGSSFGEGIDTSTFGGAIRYLPLGLVYFLFAPFPWAISSVLQLITLPEVLLWYALVPFTLIGLRDSFRREYPATLLIIGVLALSVSSYALVEGTFGTAYRHRSQFLPLFFIFAARGLVSWWTARAEDRRRRRMRALDARAALLQPRRD